MKYIYGKFSNKQIKDYALLMHKEIHKLLCYKDQNLTVNIFDSDEEFITYFTNLLVKFGGLNKILGEPELMVEFMSTMQAAFDEVLSGSYTYKNFRRLILDAHGYIRSMFEEV